MKIRTKLLFFLLPMLCISNISIAAFMYQKRSSSLKEHFHAQFLASLKEDTTKPTFTCEHFTIEKQSLATKPLDAFFFYDKDTMTTQVCKGPGTFIEYTVKAEKIVSKLQQGLLSTVFLTLISLFGVTTALMLTARYIVEPVQQLQNAALLIASGEYGQTVSVQGPKEFSDLSTTLNTMSECLQDTMHRLKESSCIQDHYSETTCATQLQKFMLDIRAESSKSDAISMKTLSLLSNEPKGLLLDLLPKKNQLDIELVEAEEKGLEGMYNLLRNYKMERNRFAFFKGSLQNTGHFSSECSGFPPPFFWSFANRTCEKMTTKAIQLHPGD